MKNRLIINSILGIGTEILYTLLIILIAFIACLIFSLKR
jgi:hypothetical protein